ncbi:hypothetical protein [Roseibium litorale]|uniref:Uncharacterized protein n=1 Tax=Roseibium litorale TaxID=2803841 RepID=A0ABR9CH44_9HYPH|nr:hypothetical protein [Roseibium litorale]MBD8890182.1 hypothetical protein [Roseibium litorale]
MSANIALFALCSAFAAAGIGLALAIAALGDAKRKADREFGDWPDQVDGRVREMRQPDDPGVVRETI